MRASIYALAVAALLTTTAALAQQSPQPAPGQQMQGPMTGQGMMMGQGMAPGMMGPGMMMGPGTMPMMGMMDPARHVEGRLAFLRAELKITEAQTPQWNAFADALRANAKRMGDLMGTAMSGGMMGPGMMGQGTMGPGVMMSGQAGTGMSLPERFGRAEQHVTTHLEMLRAMKGPTTQLYAALSDEQKRVADSLLHGPMGMMGMM